MSMTCQKIIYVTGLLKLILRNYISGKDYKYNCIFICLHFGLWKSQVLVKKSKIVHLWQNWEKKNCSIQSTECTNENKNDFTRSHDLCNIEIITKLYGILMSSKYINLLLFEYIFYFSVNNVDKNLILLIYTKLVLLW